MTDWTTGTSPDWQFPDARCASYHPGRDNAPHTQSPLCERAASIVSPMQAGDQYSVGTGLTSSGTSDGANPALQAWDMLHGHLLLHGWLLGDATFYTFELPLIALVEVFFGLHTIVMHVAMAAIYLIVAACAVAIAVTGATGAAARLSRAAVVTAVLTAPALVMSDRWIPLGSLPLATAVRAVMRHLGAYQMVSPRTSLVPVSHWPHN